MVHKSKTNHSIADTTLYIRYVNEIWIIILIACLKREKIDKCNNLWLDVSLFYAKQRLQTSSSSGTVKLLKRNV